MSFLNELARRDLIKDDEISEILSTAEKEGRDVDSVLVDRGMDQETLMEVKGAYLKMPVRVLEDKIIPQSILKYIAYESAKYYGFVPIGFTDSVLEIGIIDPNNIDAIDALQFISTQTKMSFKLYLISGKDFASVLDQYEKPEEKKEEEVDSNDISEFFPDETDTPKTEKKKKSFKSLQRKPSRAKKPQKQPIEGRDAKRILNEVAEEDELEVIKNEEDDAPAPGASPGEEARRDSLKEDLKEELRVASSDGASAEGDDDADPEAPRRQPVSKMVAVILRHATEGGASDVHIEHTGERVRVRFRIDGDLHTSILLPANVHAAMVSRIKILSNLKLDEKRKPQDGRFSAVIDDRQIDFRVSTYPAYYGEKVVMRILDSSQGIKSLDDIGFDDHALERIRHALKRPYGMILITGPTGSGKSTTLYSMLKEVDRQINNVVSLEDPVEYNVDGVSQSNVRPDIGYTFANGLRSILRQDPDVIMVGEIRDKETAQLAIQAALTGHLVFSTLHTNTAAGAIPRLIDMGVDPYLIAPTLIMAMGQRLSRAMCEGAGKEIPVDESMKKMFDEMFDDLPEKYRKEIKFPDHVYEAKPTTECPTGTSGRQAVLELLEVDASVRKVILDKPVESEVFQAARKNGMLTMKEDALLKAFEGKIPYVEVNKL